jgi:hypothetical protein
MLMMVMPLMPAATIAFLLPLMFLSTASAVIAMPMMAIPLMITHCALSFLD